MNTTWKIAWRQLLKNKFISAVNLAGLLVGMTAVLLIWQYVHFENNYDAFNEKADRIFRIRTDRVKDGVPFMQFAGGTACAAPLLKNNFAEVENYVKLKGAGEVVFLTEQNVAFREEDVYFAMPSLFDIFSFPLVKGNVKTCLSEPFTACLSASVAKKMFGDADPIGKTIQPNGKGKFSITGVFDDCPEQSHLKFSVLLSYCTFSEVLNTDGQTETSPTWDGYFSYVLLKPQTDWKALEAKIPAVIEKTYNEEVRKSLILYLQPLKDIHLTSDYLIEAEVNGDGVAVRFLFIIGILVLFIAWFNYINLATARSEMRAKEVGVRKVIGSSRGRLIGQFLSEAVLINVFAITGAVLSAQLLNPLFCKLLDKSIPGILSSSPGLLAAILGIFMVGTLLAGLYPAFLLSSFKPASILKSGFSDKKTDRGNWFRKGLVVVQFVASVGLIAGTLVVYRQLHFMQDSKLGMNIDQILVLKGPRVIDSTYTEKSKTFQRELKQFPTIGEIAGSSTVPGQAFGWTAGGVHLLGEGQNQSQNFHVMAGDAAYSTLYQMDVAAGRHLSEAMPTDRSACLLNETGAKLLQFQTPEAAIGRGIEFWGDRYTIVGVLKDFYQESPKSIVEPLILTPQPPDRAPGFYSIKLKTQQLPQTIDAVKEKWAALFPGNPFDYFFLDDHFNEQYAADQRFGKVFSLFSALAIFVSCLGLFALVAFVAERRKREIGIRKVLGASVENIVTLLSKDFIRLVVIAMLIATPMARYFMNGWLENFANHIEIRWWVFAAAGSLAMAVAFLTVGFQSLKAALTDPVNTLRE